MVEGKNGIKGFTFFYSYYDELSALPSDMQLVYYKAICNYAFNGIEPDNLTGTDLAFWRGIRNRIDLSFEKAKHISKVRSDAAKTGGGAPLGNKNASKTIKTVRILDRANSDEVSFYCSENGYNIDAEKFVAHYDNNGWRTENPNILNWKDAVREYAKTEAQTVELDF